MGSWEKGEPSLTPFPLELRKKCTKPSFNTRKLGENVPGPPFSPRTPRSPCGTRPAVHRGEMGKRHAGLLYKERHASTATPRPPRPASTTGVRGCSFAPMHVSGIRRAPAPGAGTANSVGDRRCQGSTATGYRPAAPRAGECRRDRGVEVEPCAPASKQQAVGAISALPASSSADQPSWCRKFSMTPFFAYFFPFSFLFAVFWA